MSLYKILSTILFLSVSSLVSASNEFPNKPIRFITNTLPGQGTDIVARAVGNSYNKHFTTLVVIDPRPGASGLFAIDQLMKSSLDGHTISMITVNQVLASITNPNWPGQILDLVQPVTQISKSFYVIYSTPSLNFNSFNNLISYAKHNPNKLLYGSSGEFSIFHLAWQMIANRADIKLVHIPFKSTQPALISTLSGEVHLGMAALLSIRSHIENKKLNALAITSSNRSKTLPQLPTVSEFGITGYEIYQWYGIVTNRKTSTVIVEKLNQSIRTTLKDPQLLKLMEEDDVEIVGSSQINFSKFIQSEHKKWKSIVQSQHQVLK